MRWQLSLVIGLILLPAAARADVKPHALCREGMVLQQNSAVVIWGKADQGEKVTVMFRGQKATGMPNAEGDWSVTVNSGAAGGPEEMVIEGKNRLHYKNVLVGEVWLCSGQSNMEWSVGGCDKSDKDYAFSAPHDSQLRMFRVRKTPKVRPEKETAGSWVEADAKTIGNWTAVGYFFGRDLREHVKVPVGLIEAAWGGTRAEAWTSPRALASSPSYKAEIEKFQQTTQEQQPGSKGPDANAPSVLFNGLIAPVVNYRIKGAIWYQGESNAGQAYAYRKLFPLMIADWRTHWNQPNDLAFPFYFVQLAPHWPVVAEPGESTWAELREAQLLTLKLPHTGMAVITDYGDERDIHPTPKRPVGERLALIARAKDYGEKVEYSGPALKAMKIDGNKVMLSFEHTVGDLVTKELVPVEARKNSKAWRVKEGATNAKLVGFTVCGPDHRFHPADAQVEGTNVIVTCDRVPEPVAVRYGWADHPVCNLFNSAGLPASPFRTDDFRGITAPKK
jgi:sialate O-acetylesterase